MVSLIFSDSRGKGSREVVWWAPSLFLERRQDQREILLHFWKKSSEDVSSSKNREDVSSSKNTLICDPPSVTAIPILSEQKVDYPKIRVAILKEISLNLKKTIRVEWGNL